MFFFFFYCYVSHRYLHVLTHSFPTRLSSDLAAKNIQSPLAISAAFEDLKVAQAISERMQDRVIADMRRWLDAGIDFGHVALNAAAAEFRQNDFAERLLGNLHEIGRAHV